MNDKAAARYQPLPYDGRVAVFRSKGSFAGYGSPSLGWDRVVGQGLEIHGLPVLPKGMLIEPFSAALAERLVQVLSEPSRTTPV